MAPELAMNMQHNRFVQVRHDYRLFRQLLWQGRKPLVKLCLFGAVCLAVILWGAYVQQAQPHRSQIADLLQIFGFIGCVGMVAGWIGLMITWVRRQHRPEYAALVPGLHLRLKRLLGGQVIVASVLLATLCSLVFGHFAEALALAGLGLTWQLLMVRYQPLILFTSIAYALLTQTDVGRSIDLTALAPSGNSALAVSMVVVLLNLALLDSVLCRLLPRTKDAQRTATRLQVAIAPLWRPRRNADRGTMLLRALGPRVPQYGDIVPATVIALLSMAGAMLLPEWRPGLLSVIMATMLATFLHTPLQYAELARSAIAATVAEQGLYRLAPLSPAAPDLNRLLYRALLQRYLLIWLACAVTTLGLAAMSAGRVAIGGAALLCALALPGGRRLLHRYAQEPAPAGWKHYAGMATWYVSCALVMSIAGQLPELPWLALAVVVAVWNIVRLYLRWRALLSTPPALPAGRLVAQ